MGLFDFVGGIFGAETEGEEAAKEAAQAQADAARRAIELQREIFQQQQLRSAPFQRTGTQALFSLADLFGVPRPERARSTLGTDITDAPAGKPSPEVVPEGTNIFGIPVTEMFGDDVITEEEAAQRRQEQSPEEISLTEPGGQRQNALQQFFTSPGFQFRKEQGMDALQNSLAARGLAQSGPAAQEAIRFGQGLASQEFNNFANRLASIAGVGQTATQNVNRLGSQFGQTAGNLQTQIGNAQASGFIGAQRADPFSTNNLMNLAAQAGPAIASALSDRRFKRDIQNAGKTPGGYNWYHFRFHDDEQWYQGVMADEVEPHIPEAVYTEDGYRKVDYSRIP